MVSTAPERRPSASDHTGRSLSLWRGLRTPQIRPTCSTKSSARFGGSPLARPAGRDGARSRIEGS
jgi:hypothetical protein